MRIDPTVEKPTRDMLGHAIRGEFDELADTIEAIGEERLLVCLVLCLEIAGYIAIDICGHKWPTKADVHEIAQVISEKEKVAGLPILITATLLVTYRQHETHWYDYLDEIEEA